MFGWMVGKHVLMKITRPNYSNVPANSWNSINKLSCLALIRGQFICTFFNPLMSWKSWFHSHPIWCMVLHRGNPSFDYHLPSIVWLFYPLWPPVDSLYDILQRVENLMLLNITITPGSTFLGILANAKGG